MENQDQQEVMRHSLAHVLAQAILRLFPDTKLGIGPVIGETFYYDAEIPFSLTNKDLKKIELEMQNIISESLPFKQIVISRDQAFDTLLQLGQIYKTELLQQVPDSEISFYKTGDDFIDLCRGPHVSNTSMLGFFKLISIENTNWLGDANRPSMQRVSGVAFSKETDLAKYLKRKETSKLFDHRVLGPQLKLFTDASKSKGTFNFLSQGKIIKNLLENKLTNLLQENNFQLFETPEIIYTKKSLNNKNQIGDYSLRTDASLQLLQVYKSNKYSYKSLPLRFSDIGICYVNKFDYSSGLYKPKRITKDTNLSFCTKKDSINELKFIINLIETFLSDLGFKDLKKVIKLNKANIIQETIEKNNLNWEEAIYIIEKALFELKISSSKQESENLKYGPQLEFQTTDIYDNPISIAKITLELNKANLFQINYVNQKGNLKKPYIFQYTLTGSLEKLIALLIENTGGAFPFWLSPIQMYIIPISEKFNAYSSKVAKQLIDSGYRTFIDDKNQTMQTKVRKAMTNKIPYLLIIGEKEKQTNSISVRPRTGQDLGLMRIEEFLSFLKPENR